MMLPLYSLRRTMPVTSRCVSVTSACSASRSGENQKPLETSSLHFGRRMLLDWIHRAPLQSRRQVNRCDHAAGAPAAKLNRREFKQDDPRIAAQSFALVLGQCSIGATGKRQQLLSTLIV